MICPWFVTGKAANEKRSRCRFCLSGPDYSNLDLRSLSKKIRHGQTFSFF